MARARNIKPGLFSNELLVELPAFDRLAFIGLWCLADREGRLEDRVKRIKIELFPCDDYDVESGLTRLAEAGFITRYQVAGFSVIEIVNFQKHQSPHGTEKDSTLPDANGYLTVYARKGNVVVAGSQQKVLVAKPVLNVKEPLEHVNPPLDNALIPDCGFLIPDSLIPDSPKQDQHSSHSASDEVPVSGAEQKPTPEESSVVEPDLESEQPLEPVNPKAPVEMTLDWEPDTKLLKNYALRMTLPVSIFTPEATASFVCHYTASGRMETQDVWVALLVKWIKTDRNQQSNVRQFPARRQSSEPDFDSSAWAKDLVVTP